MSIGKVRIYELSKELNLDNKDILAVCDQLKIAVKSHSSTITEEQAEKIRHTAQKGMAHSSKGSSSSRPAAATRVADAEKEKEPRKQQILAVRRQPLQPPVLAEKPAAPGETPKQTTEASAHALEAPQSAATAEPSATPTPPAHKPAAHPAESTVSVDIAPDATDAARPSGNKRTAEDPGARTLQQAALLQKPILKRSQAKSAPSAASASPEQPTARKRETIPVTIEEAPTKATPRASVPTLLKKPSQAGPSRPGTPGAPEIVEHRREGKSSVLDTVANADELSIEVVTGDALPKLKRPGERPSSPGRGKRGKHTAEEEEIELITPKTAKGSGKQKRRTQDEEEDDDFFGDDSAIQTTVVDVSQSLVRPPKPKAAKQSRPAPSPAAKSSPSKSGGSRRQRGRDRQAEVVVERPEEITLTNSPTVQELARLLVVPETDVIKVLFLKGIAANINQTLDLPTATAVAEELGTTVETVEAESAARKVTEMLDVGDLESLQRRPPVVTIMGHVDHGKTTLLDSIRKTKVAQGEAGGITQHIGAYHVDLEHDGKPQQVVFLDTPGHAAFTAMRARGARVTDIAILVVAADDGVRPQTIEAISHAQAAKVPIIVAINKMDKEAAQPDRVKQELTEFGLVSEEWGGETVMVPVSALKGENLDTLLEMILLVSEVEDLQANPDRPAKGTVIEANLDKARGPVATLLVQNGTLRVGDVLVAGSSFGKVRAMIDDRGQRVDYATPSFAVEVLGLSDVPAAGDEFDVMPDEKEARALAGQRADEQRQSRLQQAMASRRISLTSLSDQAREGELKELNIILKADVQGSVEAILASLGQLPQNEVQVRVLLSAPGEITETDVDLAAASNAVIIGFNTSLASGARQAADAASIDIREYNIIYKLLEDIQGAMEGLLEPELVEERLGQTQVRAVFPVGRGAVAGCYIQEGKLLRNCRVRVRRGEAVVFEGILDSLKRMKEDVREVNFGYECGVRVDNFNEWQEGDIIEAYQLVTKRRTLSAAN
jgi:translation initiation factor IF-2